MRWTVGIASALVLGFLGGCGSGSGSDETAAALAGGPALPAGLILIEQVDKQGADDIVIPYSMYELDNGLRVILHEDHSDPLVHVDVTFHVGSAREELGKSGFAHFFEHMLFQGSENVGDDEHFRIVSEAGGTLNGSTNSDRTNYFETVPSNQLEKVLWLEADRMGFLLPAVTQEKFEIQRETVKNERGQNYDNRPYGLVGEITDEALYPAGHPYSWQTIGYIEDLNRANLDDLKKFFLRWYGPNNAVLTIGGDLDVRQTLEWIVKYFGPIPRGPEVADPLYQPVTLDGDRYISMEDRVALPLVEMSWPTVYRFHPDEAPLDVLYSIIGSGRTSLLYKNLVRDGLAVNASAGHGCAELSCTFTMSAQPNPASGTTLAELEAIMRASLAEFEQRGVLEDDLIRMKADMRSSAIFGLESVRGKVSDLAYFATFADTPNYMAQDVARYERVTADDVMRVYRQYIKDKPAVIVSVVPNGESDAIAAPDNWQAAEREFPVYAASTLELREPVDNFDRSIAPAPAATNPAIKLPEIWHDELANGIEVLGAVNDETPTTALRIQFEAGQRMEPLDKLGLASLTARMLNEATESSTNEELSNRLQKLGSSVSVNAGSRFTTVTVRSLSENLAETMAIAAERLFTPAFAEEDFQRLKNQTLQSIEQSKTQAATVADDAFDLLLFGRANSIAYPGIGLADTVRNISLDDIRSFYERAYSPATASIVAVSNIPADELVSELAVLESWSGDAAPAPTLSAFPELKAGTLYLIDKPNAAQSEIRVGKRALPYDATGEFYRAGLMNFSLGGAFSSRINLNLREDKGYTYGARSGFAGNDRYGYFVADAGVRTDATAASVTEFISEIDGYASRGITDEELAFTKRAIGQSDARSYETPGQKLGILSDIVTYDLPEDFIDQQNEILESIEKPEIDFLAAQHLDVDDMIIIVVGDREAVLPGLQDLNLPIVELDADANPL
jgi:zinc protease